MSNPYFDTPHDRRHSNSVKWDRYAGRDVLPMWVADMDFQAPPPVTQALQQRVSHGIFGYSHAGSGLVEALCHWARQHYDWTLEPEWLMWIPGAVPALNAACRLIEPDQSVVTTTPIYPPFLAAPGHMQRRLLEVPMVHDDAGTAHMNVEHLAQAFRDQGRLLFLCNPHNPLGRVFGRDELESVAECVLAHDTLVVSDELHADLILEPGLQHQPLAALSPELAARTITLLAPSKTFNIAGLGLSCAVIADADLRARFANAIDGILPYVNTLGYVAAEAAWRDGGDWHRQLVDYLRGNRDLISETLARLPQVRAQAPEATYLYWLDLRGCGIDDPVAHLEEHGLGLSDGADFGAPGFARLNFACPRVTLEAGLARLTEALR